MIFQCKNCGGNVVYSPEKKKMFCPYCESEESEQRKDSQGDITVCPNCGGEVPVKEYTSAARCPYCDNYIIFNERVEGQYTPKLILPFQHGKEKVKQLMRDKFKGCTFAPTDFLSEVRLNTMEGDYVPFWLYDYDVDCQYQGEGRKVRVWQSGDTEYTETSIFDIYRDMDISFDKIPADASKAMPDEIMDLMEPYDYKQLEAFKPEYMSGFLGERYNFTADETENRAESRMRKDAETFLKRTVSGYASVTDRNKNIHVKDKKNTYALLPVWVYTYKYKDKEYPFYINGQTAKIVGKVPVSRAKVLTYGVTLWAVLTAVLGLISGIISIWSM